MNVPKNLSDRLFFDIETTVHPRADEFLGLDSLTADDLTVAELKDILKDAAHTTNIRLKDELVNVVKDVAQDLLAAVLVQKTAEQNHEAIEKAPLDPDLGRIRSIGVASGDGVINVTIANENPAGELLQIFGGIAGPEVYPMEAYYSGGIEAEKMLIEWFWQTAVDHRLQLVGFNILNFDLPFLMRRSMDLGIRVPNKLSLRRYQVEPICDLMQILSHWGAFKHKSLKWFCQRYDITIPMPETDGSMVKDMDDPTLAQYTASDVWTTRELWKKMDGIYWPKVPSYPNPKHPEYESANVSE